MKYRNACAYFSTHNKTQLICVPHWNIHEIPCYPSSVRQRYLSWRSKGASEVHLTLPLNNPAVHRRSQTLLSHHCWFPQVHSIGHSHTWRVFSLSLLCTYLTWHDMIWHSKPRARNYDALLLGFFFFFTLNPRPNNLPVMIATQWHTVTWCKN